MVFNFDFANSDFRYSLAIKFALSISLLVTLIFCTVSQYHRRDIKLNRISMLPYYTMLGQAVFMITYYGAFGLFGVWNTEPYVYSIWRTILSTPE